MCYTLRFTYLSISSWQNEAGAVFISISQATKSGQLHEVPIVTGTESGKSQGLNPHLPNSKAHAFNHYLDPS